jgi:uncharacterized membrane protein YfcA
MNVLAFSLIVCAASVLAGFLGALTGLGGGVVIVPVLCLLFKVDLHYAIGASLISVMATSSGAATTTGALLGAYLTASALVSGSIETIPILLDGDPKDTLPRAWRISTSLPFWFWELTAEPGWNTSSSAQ